MHNFFKLKSKIKELYRDFMLLFFSLRVTRINDVLEQNIQALGTMRMNIVDILKFLPSRK